MWLFVGTILYRTFESIKLQSRIRTGLISRGCYLQCITWWNVSHCVRTDVFVMLCVCFIPPNIVACLTRQDVIAARCAKPPANVALKRLCLFVSVYLSMGCETYHEHMHIRTHKQCVFISFNVIIGSNVVCYVEAINCNTLLTSECGTPERASVKTIYRCTEYCFTITQAVTFRLIVRS